MNDFFSKIPFHSKWISKNNPNVINVIKNKQTIESNLSARGASADLIKNPSQGDGFVNLNSIEYSKKYYENNKNEVLQKKKSYYQNKKEEILEKRKLYYQKKKNNNI